MLKYIGPPVLTINCLIIYQTLFCSSLMNVRLLLFLSTVVNLGILFFLSSCISSQNNYIPLACSASVFFRLCVFGNLEQTARLSFFYFVSLPCSLQFSNDFKLIFFLQKRKPRWWQIYFHTQRNNILFSPLLPVDHHSDQPQRQAKEVGAHPGCHPQGGSGSERGSGTFRCCRRSHRCGEPRAEGWDGSSLLRGAQSRWAPFGWISLCCWHFSQLLHLNFNTLSSVSLLDEAVATLLLWSQI